MLIFTGTATGLMASGLVMFTDASHTSWKYSARPSFSYRHSPFWSETNPQMGGSSGTMLVTLYDRKNITSFKTTTILSTGVAVDSHQMSLPSDFVPTTVPPSTVMHVTTIISSPQPSPAAKSTSVVRNSSERLHTDRDDKPAPSLGPSIMTATAPNDASQSGCQEIIISIILHLTSPSSPSTAYPEDTLPLGSPVQPLNPPSGLNVFPSNQEPAKGHPSMVTALGASDTSAAKLRCPIPTSAVIRLAGSTTGPPYPMNFSTTFLDDHSDSARGVIQGSASTVATSVHPSLFHISSHSVRIPFRGGLISTLTDPFSTSPTMVSLLFTKSSVNTLVEVISLVE